MKSHRERHRRTFGLESLEGRLAPSGGLSHGMGVLHEHAHPEHNGRPVEVQHHQRGRDVAKPSGRNDVPDNDPNDLNDPNEAAEGTAGADPNDGPNHDSGGNHRGRGAGSH